MAALPKPSSLTGLTQAARVGQIVDKMGAKKSGPPQTPESTPAAYMPPSEGPFECEHCQFYVLPSHCIKPQVVQELGAAKDGPPGAQVAKVDAHGCCNFYKKKTKGK